MKRWYVAQTLMRAEDRAEFHLRNQAYNVFLPRHRKQRKHARRIESVLRPLFPGYLFVELDLTQQQWRPINGTIGVLGLICSGYSPLPAPQGIVEQMIARSDNAGAIQIQSSQFEKGQRVHIESGAFADCEGLFEELLDEKRVILLLDLLGRKVRTIVPTEALAAAI